MRVREAKAGSGFANAASHSTSFCAVQPCTFLSKVVGIFPGSFTEHLIEDIMLVRCMDFRCEPAVRIWGWCQWCGWLAGLQMPRSVRFPAAIVFVIPIMHRRLP